MALFVAPEPFHVRPCPSCDPHCKVRFHGDSRIPRSHTRRRTDRKLLQLCSQVADTLNQVLSGECNDDVLRDLYVLSVTPAPNAAQLLVVVASLIPNDDLSPAVVVQQLASHAAHLRHAVAEAITRRRAPRLLFQFASNPSDGDGR